MSLDAFDLEENIEIAEFIFNFFTSPITDSKLFTEIQKTCTRKTPYLSANNFVEFRMKKEGLGTPVPILSSSLNFLVREHILAEFKPSGSMEISYMANETVALPIYRTKTFKNLILGFEFIARKYKSCILKIEVKNPANTNSEEAVPDISMGTGFILSPSISSKPLVITNKHVVEGKESVTLYDAENNMLEFESIKLCQEDDIAAIVLKTSYLEDALWPKTDLQILDEIITLGFPSIPITKDAYIVAHKGEINSFVETYWGNQRFVISARTSPGSSGSPIIGKSGCFLGMVTELLFEENSFKERGVIPYYAGIPASEIMNFVHSQFPVIIRFC